MWYFIFMSTCTEPSPYTPYEHLAAAKEVLDENDIVAAVNYIEGEVVGLDQLDIENSVVADTLKAITTPHLEEVGRARIHEQARGVVYPIGIIDKRKNIVTKWFKRSRGTAPAEEQIRLFLNVAMDYEDPICARAALPYLNRVTHTRISYSVLHNVMSRIAGFNEV
jgi:hypothetical protein